MPRRTRRQKVVLRQKHREELKRLVRRTVTRTAIVMLAIGFGLGLITHGDVWVVPFVARHTPDIHVQAPGALAGLPVEEALPSRRIWLWLPGSEASFRRKLMQRYPEIHTARLEKHFLNNRIVVHMEPRVPLVAWANRGMDNEGALFPLTQASAAALPKAVLPETKERRSLGQWLAVLALKPELWNNIQQISQNVQGDFCFDMKTGTRVEWGSPDVTLAAQKARYLSWVLQDAHERLGGAATADIRFFEDGRVVIRPKSAGLSS